MGESARAKIETGHRMLDEFSKDVGQLKASSKRAAGILIAVPVALGLGTFALGWFMSRKSRSRR